MSTKHRNYPELPTLSLQMPDGRKEELKPCLCAEQAAELVLTLAMGVDGDLITHAYTLSLGRVLEKYKLEPEMVQKIQRLYADRLRGRIKLDAVLLGTDLWLRTAAFKFPNCEPVVFVEPEEVWMQMASGMIRPDRVHLEVSGETKEVHTVENGQDS